MKNRILPLALLLCTVTASAQNLVPNGSFEEYTECPDYLGQIDHAVGWFGCGGTADYYNECGSSDMAGIPLNYAANRFAATGTAYAGVIGWNRWVSEREFLGIELSAPLQIGVPLHVGFKVSASYGGTVMDCRWTNDRLGLRFSMGVPLYNANQLPNAANVYSAALPSIGGSWSAVSGVFVPDSAYEYLSIGVFFDDSLLAIEEFNPSGNFDRSYVLIDDVCVSYSSGECDLSQGVRGGYLDGMLLYPNPVRDVLHLLLPHAHAGHRLELKDCTGRVLWQQDLNGRTSIEIDLSQFGEGAYSISLLLDGELPVSRMVIRANL